MHIGSGLNTVSSMYRQQKGNNMKTPASGAVSYTHLDVYKRQGSWKVEENQMIKKQNALLQKVIATFGKVSGDVYKRQPVCLSLLSWAHAPFRRFHYCRLTGLYHTFRNRGNF